MSDKRWPYWINGSVVVLVCVALALALRWIARDLAYRVVDQWEWHASRYNRANWRVATDGKMFRAELFHRFLHGSAWIATTEPMTNIADVVDYIDHEVASKPKPSWVPVPSISVSAPVGEMRVKP